jgi:hypothetical protein
MEEKKEDPFNDPEEQAHFKQVVAAFFNYSVRTILLSLFNSLKDRCYERYSQNGERFH